MMKSTLACRLAILLVIATGISVAQNSSQPDRFSQTSTRSNAAGQKPTDSSDQVAQTGNDPQPSHRADWMRQARWGVMTHFLAEWIEPEAHADAKAWNAFVDGFDTEGLAEQLKSVGAGYYIITIGQNSGFYDAPNETYDRLVGIQPSHCSKRDLISDLSQSLTKRGIRLIVYLPAGAPGGDATARKALEWQNGPHRNREFEIKWEQIIRDWSMRWGKKVSGWWFDGVYWPNYMYRSAEPPNFASFAAAARAGNPDSAVAFNPGVIYRTISLTPEEDYTAGEVANPELVEIRRTFDGRADGVQIHMLSHIGQQWGKGPSRFSDEQIIRWTKDYLSHGGVVTWDVPIQPNGHISKPFVDQLSALGKALAQK